MNRYITILSTLLALNACSHSSGYPNTPAMTADTGQPALHAVRDTELRGLMDRMNNLMQERFLTEQELDIERRKHARRIAGVAWEMSLTVEDILSRLPALKLSEAEQATFRALAGKLREQTRHLREEADRNQIDAIPESLNQIISTCNSCHALFRTLEPKG